MREAAIETVRPLDGGSVSCGVTVELSIGERAAPVVSAWHYAEPGAAPRLVTARSGRSFVFTPAPNLPELLKDAA